MAVRLQRLHPRPFCFAVTQWQPPPLSCECRVELYLSFGTHNEMAIARDKPLLLSYPDTLIRTDLNSFLGLVLKVFASVFRIYQIRQAARSAW